MRLWWLSACVPCSLAGYVPLTRRQARVQSLEQKLATCKEDLAVAEDERDSLLSEVASQSGWCSSIELTKLRSSTSSRRRSPRHWRA